MPEKPTWQEVADFAAQLDGAHARHEGHRAARPARLGPGLRPAHHRRQHLRRHLVRRGLDRQGQRPGVRRGDEVLRRPRQGPRRVRRPAGRVHRVPQRHDPVPGRHVVRRDLGRRLARRRGLPRRGQDGLRRRPRDQDRVLGLALHLGVGHPEGLQEPGRTPGSSSPGPPARSTRSSSARSSAGPACPPASATRPTRTPTTRSRRPRSTRPPRTPSTRPTPRTRACSRARPPGIQFVAIPEFADLGTQVSQGVSSAIAGQMHRRGGPRPGPGPARRSWSATSTRSDPHRGARPPSGRPRPRATGQPASSTPTRTDGRSTPSTEDSPMSTSEQHRRHPHPGRTPTGPAAHRRVGPQGRRLGPPRPAAAGPALHDRRDPAAVRGDASSSRS